MQCWAKSGLTGTRGQCLLGEFASREIGAEPKWDQWRLTSV